MSMTRVLALGAFLLALGGLLGGCSSGEVSTKDVQDYQNAGLKPGTAPEANDADQR